MVCRAGAHGVAAGAVGHGQPAHVCSRVSKRVPLLRRSAWRRCRRCRARAACAYLFKGLEKGATAAQERVATLQALSGTGSLRMFVQGSRKGCHCCAGARGDAAGAVGHGQPAHVCSRVSKRVPLLRRSAWRRCSRCRARAACAWGPSSSASSCRGAPSTCPTPPGAPWPCCRWMLKRSRINKVYGCSGQSIDIRKGFTR